jgi:FixJ family two-component response regulator
MTSAAITAIPRQTPISLAHMLGHEMESRPRSHGAPIVFVVDDDISVRESLEVMIGCEGWQPETFASAQEFLACPRALVPSCLVLDVSLPGLNGLDLQKLVAVERTDMPVILITGVIDVRMAVQAMKAGAVEFLTKPFGDAVLLSATRQALERSRATLGHQAQMRTLWNCYASLTRRERQVMALVVAGLLNKQAAGEPGISEITVKAHRRPGDAKDEGGISRRVGENGREAPSKVRKGQVTPVSCSWSIPGRATL